MPRCLVSLGSNLGDRHAVFEAAIESLHKLANRGTLQTSTWRETVPVGGAEGQTAFLNGVVSFHSRSEPTELLRALQQIEQSLDRERHERWAARTLDLDLLLYGEETVSTPVLRVPHPRMSFRPFVLEPACEIAADWWHSECDQTLSQLLQQLAGGGSGLAIVGDDDGLTRSLVDAVRPEVPHESAENPRLLLDARPDPWPLPPSGPRLVLADCPREHWRDEVVAALECVWPASA